MTEIDFPFLLQLAQTGAGVMLVGTWRLATFAELAAREGFAVSNIETYELRGDLEIPRIELGQYDGGSAGSGLPPEERGAIFAADLAEIIASCDAEALPFLFRVWVHDLLSATREPQAG